MSVITDLAPAGVEVSTPAPLLSVIVATYNRERFIGAALASILRQSYPAIEIIVIDDGSTDATGAIVADLASSAPFPIHYRHQANAGAPAALNRGLRLASGAVIGFLDSDDLWPDDRLPGGIARLSVPAEGGAPPGIILGRAERFADGVQIDPAELAAANERPYHFNLSAALIARRVFDSIGDFDESMPYCADWDWFARAREAGVGIAVDPRVTLRMSVHGGNLTQDRARNAHYTVEMIRKHLQRSRAQGPADAN